MVCEIQVLFNEFKALVNQKNGGLNNFRYGCIYRLKVNLFQTKKLTESQLDPFFVQNYYSQVSFLLKHKLGY